MVLKSTFAPPHVAALLVTAANAHGKRLLRRTGRDVLRVARMAGAPLGNGWRHRLGLEANFLVRIFGLVLHARGFVLQAHRAPDGT